MAGRLGGAAVALGLTLSGGAAAAAEDALLGATLICSFTQECLETLECIPARFSIDVSVPDALPGDASLLPPSGPVEGPARMVGASLVATGYGEDAAWLLTRSEEGFAKLSLQRGAPVEVMTYHGECRIAE